MPRNFRKSLYVNCISFISITKMNKKYTSKQRNQNKMSGYD